MYIAGRGGTSTTSSSSAVPVPGRNNAVTTAESPVATAPVSYQNTRRSANPRGGGARGAFRGRGGGSRGGFQPLAFSAPAAVQYVQFGMQQFLSFSRL